MSTRIKHKGITYVLRNDGKVYVEAVQLGFDFDGKTINQKVLFPTKMTIDKFLKLKECE